MKYFRLALLFSTLTFNLFAKNATESGYDIIFAFANKINAENSWELRSFGGNFDGKIKALYVEFNVYEETTIDNARNELMITVQKFVKFINAEPKFKDLFFEFPISEENVEIGLMYLDKKGGFLKDDKVCVAVMRNSNVIYYANGEKMLHKLRKETFLQAKEALRKQENQKHLTHFKEG